MSEQICTLLPNRHRYDGASSIFVATPLMDMVEREEGFVLYCNLPGADCGKVELSIHKGILHVRAGSVLDPIPGKIHVLEICDVVYEARLRLNAAVDTTRVKATFSQGVLRVAMPFSSSGAVCIPVTKG